MGSGARAAGHGRPPARTAQGNIIDFLEICDEARTAQGPQKAGCAHGRQNAPSLSPGAFSGPPCRRGALPRERRHPRTRAQGAQRRGPFFDHARFFLAAALLPIVLGGGTDGPPGPASSGKPEKQCPERGPGRRDNRPPAVLRRPGGAEVRGCAIFLSPRMAPAGLMLKKLNGPSA